MHPRETSGETASAAGSAGLAVLLVGLGLGRFGYPPLIPLLIRQHWFSPAQAAWLGSANLAGYLLGAVGAARVHAHLPTRWSTRLAMLAIALSFLVCAAPAAYVWFLLWRVLAGVAGGFLMVLTVPALLACVPAGHRGRAGGLIFMGVGSGIFLGGTVIPRLARLGLTAAWLGIGAVALAVTLVAWPYWDRLHDEVLLPASTPTADRVNAHWRRLMAQYCLAAVGLAPLALFWVDFIARGLGEGIAAGGRYWVLFGLAAALGPVLAGRAAETTGFRSALRMALLIEATGVALPLFATSPWALAFSSASVGAMGMGITALASGRNAELVPPALQKQAWGWLTAGFSVSFAAASWLLSSLFAHTGSHRLLFVVGSAALLLAALIASSFAPEERALVAPNEPSRCPELSHRDDRQPSLKLL